MKKLRFTILLIISALGMTSVNAQDSKSNIAITLERTACFGTCPIYTITILENGDVLYDGKDFVAVKGGQKTEIDPETVAFKKK